tara:strand:+ start:1347 stop:2279 length:933 start_codon:yes stop_codon:yes gene_type:complete
MSVEHSAYVWKLDIEPISKLVLLALADHANNEGVCWPGIQYITDKTCLSRRSILRHLKKLEDKSVISIEKQYIKNGQRLRNVYILSLGCHSVTPPRCHSVTPPRCHTVTGEAPTLYNMNHNYKETYIVSNDEKKNKVPNVQKVYKDIYDLITELPDSVGPYAIEFEKMWLSTLTSQYVDFNDWWKLYHKLLWKKPQSKKQAHDFWKKLSLDEREGLIKATVFEWMDKKIESEYRKEPAMVKMALTFIRNAELQETGLLLNSTRNALMELTTQQKNGEYRNGYKQSRTNELPKQIHKSIPGFCTTSTNTAS